MTYVYDYQVNDYGTERVLRIKEAEAGRVIGQRDPFPHGTPINDKTRAKRLMDMAKEMIREYNQSLYE